MQFCVRLAPRMRGALEGEDPRPPLRWGGGDPGRTKAGQSRTRDEGEGDRTGQATERGGDREGQVRQVESVEGEVRRGAGQGTLATGPRP